QGKVEDAFAVASMVQKKPAVSDAVRFELVRLYALGATAAMKQNHLRRAERDLAQAGGYLGIIVETNKFFDIPIHLYYLRSDKELDPLRGRDDFRKSVQKYLR